MAGGWPLAPVYSTALGFGQSTTTSTGVVLTSGAANTKGSWTQIVSSVGADIDRLVLHMNVHNMGSNVAGIDVSMGSSGNEAAGLIIQNVCVSAAGDLGSVLELPVRIPAASPITVRFAAVTASDTMNMSCSGFQSGYTESLNSCLYDTYGWPGSGNVQGLTVDAGATANTKGAYLQMTASTTNDLAGFFIGIDVQNISFTTALNCDALFDVAIGASGSESILLPNFPMAKVTGSGFAAYGPHFSPFVWIPIKAGTRVAIRSQCAVNNTTPYRTNAVSFYGIRA